MCRRLQGLTVSGACSSCTGIRSSAGAGATTARQVSTTACTQLQHHTLQSPAVIRLTVPIPSFTSPNVGQLSFMGHAGAVWVGGIVKKNKSKKPCKRPCKKVKCNRSACPQSEQRHWPQQRHVSYLARSVVLPKWTLDAKVRCSIGAAQGPGWTTEKLPSATASITAAAQLHELKLPAEVADACATPAHSMSLSAMRGLYVSGFCRVQGTAMGGATAAATRTTRTLVRPSTTTGASTARTFATSAALTITMTMPKVRGLHLLVGVFELD